MSSRGVRAESSRGGFLRLVWRSRVPLRSTDLLHRGAARVGSGSREEARVSDEWIDERDGAGGAPGVRFDAKGLVASMGSRTVSARWEQVFGVALVPEVEPRRAFVLVPRRPP